MSIFISIHLMLLFIVYRYYNVNENIYFNTSHVTVYPFPALLLRLWIRISIHLMLLFIRVGFFQILSIIKFQYISCYCLSGQPYVPTAGGANFNTSHVTVYPVCCADCIQDIKFQYISCYCLSVQNKDIVFPVNISIHLMLLFIH